VPNIFKVKTWFKDPATLKIGTVDATEVQSLITGTATLGALPSMAEGVVASASAAVVGVTAAHRVIAIPQAWIAADSGIYIAAASGIAGGIQVTAGNARSSTVSATTAQAFSYLAWR